MWLLIGRPVLFPGTNDHRRLPRAQRLTVATPTQRSVEVAAADGAPIRVTIASGGGRRPVVVVCDAPALGERLARAGFTAVLCMPRGAADAEAVLAALERGALGVDAPRYALVAPAPVAALRPRVPAAAPVDPGDEPAVERLIAWLASRLA